jgi:hypothetical protein
MLLLTAAIALIAIAVPNNGSNQAKIRNSFQEKVLKSQLSEMA